MNISSLNIQVLLLEVLFLSNGIYCGLAAYGICMSACMGTIYFSAGAVTVATGGVAAIATGPLVAPTIALCIAKCSPLLAAPTP